MRRTFPSTGGWQGSRSEVLPARSGSGFTLIEIMVVVGILGLVVALGMPSFVRSIQRAPLRQAVSDVLDACRKARAEAILKGVPFEFVIRAVDGGLTVRPAQESRSTDRTPSSGGVNSSPLEGRTSSGPVFSALLDPGVNMILIDVNHSDLMGAEEARVLFFPNGMSSEFTIVLENSEGIQRIWLESITALASVEVIR